MLGQSGSMESCRDFPGEVRTFLRSLMEIRRFKVTASKIHIIFYKTGDNNFCITYII